MLEKIPMVMCGCVRSQRWAGLNSFIDMGVAASFIKEYKVRVKVVVGAVSLALVFGCYVR